MRRSSNKRVFGLDANISSTINKSSDNVSQGDTDHNQSLLASLQSGAQDKLSECSQPMKLVLAGLMLVTMLFLVEQALYYLYLCFCCVLSVLSPLRTLVYNVPELVKTTSDVVGQESDALVSIKLDVDKLNEQIKQLKSHLEKGNIDNLETMIKNGKHSDENISDNVDQDGEVAKKLRELSLQYEKLESAINELVPLNKDNFHLEKLESSVNDLKKEITNDRMNSNEMMKQIEVFKDLVKTIGTDSSNYLNDEDISSLILSRFPVLSSLGEKFEIFESRTSLLEEKLDRDDIGSVIEKHSHNLSQHLETRLLSQVESLIKNVNKALEDDDTVDWADANLGCRVEPGESMKTSTVSSYSSLTLFGLSLWRQMISPDVIIERPHSGKSWCFR